MAYTVEITLPSSGEAWSIINALRSARETYERQARDLRAYAASGNIGPHSLMTARGALSMADQFDVQSAAAAGWIEEIENNLP
jgi:hypothetical protein